MAKVSFTKLGLKLNQDINNVEYNGQNIEVKQYLPVNKKLELISNVINLSADDNNFANPLKVDIFTTLEIIFNYADITFTEKQKEDPAKLYDILVSTGLAEKIIDAIPEEEYCEVIYGVKESIDAFYNYRNSVFGILDTISTDYSNLNFDATEIQKKLADPNNLSLVRDVLAKLG